MAKVPLFGLRQSPVVEPVQPGRVPVLLDTLDEVVLDAPRPSKTAIATRAAVLALLSPSWLGLSPLCWANDSADFGQHALAGACVETGGASGCRLLILSRGR